jgi:hypothetical protein
MGYDVDFSPEYAITTRPILPTLNIEAVIEILPCLVEPDTDSVDRLDLTTALINSEQDEIVEHRSNLLGQEALRVLMSLSRRYSLGYNDCSGYVRKVLKQFMDPEEYNNLVKGKPSFGLYTTSEPVFTLRYHQHYNLLRIESRLRALDIIFLDTKSRGVSENQPEKTIDHVGLLVPSENGWLVLEVADVAGECRLRTSLSQYLNRYLLLKTTKTNVYIRRFHVNR